MKKILLIFLFFTLTNSYTQEICKILDARNGFKDFKIGDNFSKWESQLIQFNSDEKGKYYKYVGECCKEVFTSEVEEIRLSFENNKLTAIYILTPVKTNDTDKFIASEYNFLKYSFEEIFKQTSLTSPDEISGNFSCGWFGKNISLVLTFENKGLKNIDSRFIKTYRCTIIIAKNKSLESGF